MKLYRCQHGYCGISVLQVLTGLSFRTLTRLVMEARKRCPRDYDGHRCPPRKMIGIGSGIFFSEMVEVINRRKICKNRVISQYDLPFKKDVTAFAKKFKVGTYLVLIRSHYLVIRDGLTYDNQGWAYIPDFYPFRFDQVIAYAVLETTRTTQNIIENEH